jgi:heme-degrading monooxygenase HmoA
VGAMEPREGQIVTVFRSRLRARGVDAYSAHAARMSEVAQTMPGYVEHKIFVADDGERVTLVTFTDRESHNGWRDHPEHRAAQRAGISDYYETYSISVGPVEYASAFQRSV